MIILCMYAIGQPQSLNNKNIRGGTAARQTTLTCNNWLSTPTQPSFVNIGNLNISGNKISIEAVINRTSFLSNGVATEGDIVSKHSGPPDVNYILRPTRGLITTTNGFYYTPDVCPLQLNKTYHIAMVYDGATLKYYRNGFLMSQVAATGNLIQNNWNTYIAYFAPQTLPENFVGYINEVRIWNVARTQSEIRIYMNGSLPNPTTQTGLLAYYTFDNLLNKQGNPAWNGTLNGGASINATNPNCTFVADSCAVNVVAPGFTAPDTVCVNQQVNITNTTIGGSNYFWNFCAANINQSPVGLNLGNVGNTFSFPVFTDYTLYNGNYYVFATNNLSGTLSRLDFGNSLLNTPTAVNLGNFGGVLPGNLEGIQLIFNEGQWYAIIVGGNPNSGNPSKIVKLDFGAALTNTNPVATNWGNIGTLNYPVDLHLFQENANWYGLTTNANSGTITRFNFGTSFNNVPTAINLGNPGNLLQGPTGIYAINDNNFWRVFITNEQPVNTVIRLDFGSSLLNIPTSVNLGNPGGVLHGPRDITVLKYCGENVGFVVNGATNELVRLNFNNGLQNVPSGASLGNIGNLSFPHSISKLFRVGSDLYTFVTNVNNNTITRLQFTGCTSSSIPNSALQTPPAFTYNTPGIYNVNLSIDDGLATQNAVCKQIVVLPQPVVATRADTTLCSGSSVQLTTTSNATSYSWSPATGLSGTTIASPVATPIVTTTYIVTASNGFCQKSDTVIITVNNGCAGISNIINTYTPVISLVPCDNKITVEDGSTFNTGDTVLIIQMKGATIDTTNTSNFGTVINYGNAGNYEFNYVKSRIGNVVELKNNLTRQYTIPSGKVQLIRVPYYLSTNVSATLTCLPWDGSKGGVLAFNVRDTLTLNADVDVSGRGFRGGSGIHDITNTENCNQNQFFYPADPYQASEKGEGVATLSSGKVYGKGKNANGGGGGNSHNSGGAGGANSVDGGFGGYQYELGGCSGTVPFDNRGIGGQGLTYNNATNKVFLGGGAGSGQANNPALFYPKGGNGAGIAFITANYLQGNNKNIILQGENATACTSTNGTDCHEGMGGGGSGGTLLFNINQVIGTFNCNISGGKGGNMTVGGNGRLGPGGGGSGGVIWAKQASVPGVTINQAGGANGVATSFGNDPWGATAGQNGITLFNLKIPVDTLPFQKNIDSLRIKDSLTNCNTFDFKGFSFVHVAPITSWQWTFGDGGAAATQNTVHQYASTGNYLVKLVVTDANGCKDSISKMVNIPGANTSDFSFQFDPCTPLSIQFISNAPVPLNNYWSFGDGGSVQNNQSPAHLFAAPGNYTIRYTNPSGNCVDTITKIITIGTAYQNIILTNDTTICYATSKQLLTVPSNLFCWSPAIYLNNPLLANPTTSTPQNFIYYFTSLVTGNNLIANGNFSQGNTGFTSAYTFTPANSGSGQYNVATSAGAWLGTSAACNTDHTSGTGNMLMANGSTTTGAPVWSQTVAVVPNTNYELSGWLAGLNTLNPATIHIAVNGIRLGTPVAAAGTTCQWNRFSTIWNSGLQTSINLSIIDTNSQASGNDFALDDLAFAPVFVRRDSVIINVDTPFVRAGNDTIICLKDTVRLQANGAVIYSWTPTGSLSNTGINNPFAFPALNTQYIVSGTNINGCTAKDTVNVSVKPLPVITALTNDTTICLNTSVQLNAGGGTSYAWQPANSLSNPFIANPVATPVNPIVIYSVTVAGTNGCNAKDSVIVTTKPLPLFKVDPLANTCLGNEVQLHAYGGNSYLWSPAVGLSANNISNPFASPASGTSYSVIIRDSICNESAQFNVVVNVLPLPVLTLSKSNDLDCTNGLARLAVTGANTYRWVPGNSLSDSTIASPAATPSVTTLYTVTGRSFNGCENKDTLTVLVKFEGNGMHYLPNAFTPNGDGLNECFGIKNWGQVTDLNFTIYNRWGERVFYTTNPNICWDGRYKNQLQQAGNFIYIIQAKTPCGAVDMKGSVLLIR